MVRKLVGENKDFLRKLDSRMFYLLDWKNDIPSDWDYDFQLKILQQVIVSRVDGVAEILCGIIKGQ